MNRVEATNLLRSYGLSLAEAWTQVAFIVNVLERREESPGLAQQFRALVLATPRGTLPVEAVATALEMPR